MKEAQSQVLTPKPPVEAMGVKERWTTGGLFSLCQLSKVSSDCLLIAGKMS
jgi:hypothetical protein